MVKVVSNAIRYHGTSGKSTVGSKYGRGGRMKTSKKQIKKIK